jgi:hypothetical protein
MILTQVRALQNPHVLPVMFTGIHNAKPSKELTSIDAISYLTITVVEEGIFDTPRFLQVLLSFPAIFSLCTLYTF